MTYSINFKAVRRLLYPWHRRQKPMWEMAAEVDVRVLSDFVRKSRNRKPQRRERRI